MKILGRVKLSPGQAGFYDNLTNIYLTIPSPEGIIVEGMNLTNIKRSLRSKRLMLVSGSLEPNTDVITKGPKEEVKEETKKEVIEEVAEEVVEEIVEEKITLEQFNELTWRQQKEMIEQKKVSKEILAAVLEGDYSNSVKKAAIK